MLVVPSLFEPCGLTQMIALRYGTVPIVRACRRPGRHGLRPRLFRPLPRSERNGYVFDHADNAGIESALRRAIGLWCDYPEHFRELQAQRHALRLLVETARRSTTSNIYELIRHK